MNQIKKVLDNNLLVLSVGFLILLLIAGGVINLTLMRSSAEEVNQVEESISQLYLGSDQEYLRENIKDEDIQNIETQIQQLHWLDRSTLVDSLRPVKEKHQAIKELNQIFQSNQEIINGQKGTDVSDLLLHPEVNQETIEVSLAKLEYINGGPFKNQLMSYYDHASNVLDNIQSFEQAVDQLPRDVKTRGDIPGAVNHLSELESKYQSLFQQPQAGSSVEELDQYAETLSQYILVGNKYGPYDPQVAESISSLNSLQPHLIGSVFDENPLIALTFDDGPNDTITPQLLDILAKHDVKATFFVMGAYVDDHPDIAKRIVDEGHIIANHTYNHYDLSTLTEEEILTQFRWTQDSIRDATGVDSSLYRMPFGAGGSRVVELLNEYDMTSILWNLDTLDWQSQNVDSIMNTIYSQLKHHTLLLMHDTHQATPDTIDQLIPILKEAGYHFVKPTQLSYQQRYFPE